MIVYQSTKSGFASDVLSNQIDTNIRRAFITHLGRDTSPNEVLSWQNSMLYMNNVLADEEIPDQAGISIEFQVPLTSKRIDFIITGLDKEKNEKVIIVELKQWQNASLTNKDAIVRTWLNHTEREVAHPSYQAWTYAALLENFNQTVQDNNISLIPCAYLHNYLPDSVITNPFYSEYLQKAPVFLKPDAMKLRDFIKKYVRFGDDKDILYRIENGRLRPSKQLADAVASMLTGNREFIMIDDQKIVYETAMTMARKAKPDKKQVLIVQGGPGTGKSVVAINLLADLTKEKFVTRYVSKNAAPRAVYKTKLTGTLRRTNIDNLFGGSGSFYDCEPNIFDVLIVDEAHRLNAKSGLYQNLGDNQIKEIINASKCAVFFIDNNQRIHLKDIGDSHLIEQLAKEEGAVIKQLTLASQFRCNGSDGYLAWIDHTLQLRETANFNLSQDDFDLRVFDSPNELRQVIETKNKLNNSARLVAGYCWDWISKKNSEAYDIALPEWDFKMKWNLNNDGSTWIIAENSINECGCIHTCQGLELDYVGVIIGPDMIFREGKIVTNINARSSNDRSIHGVRQVFRENPTKGRRLADEIIKNTYRTLLTRGMKGCYVYCCDQALAQHIKSRIIPSKSATSTSYKQGFPLFNLPKASENANIIQNTVSPRIEATVNDDVKFVDYLPLYTIKAACGLFSSWQKTEEEGWIKVSGLGRLNQNYFVIRATGKSMEPTIPDGSLCVFRRNVVGSRHNKIVLIQHNDLYDSDYGGAYTIKKYSSQKTFDAQTGEWTHERIELKPINPDFASIELREDGQYEVIGEFLGLVQD